MRSELTVSGCRPWPRLAKREPSRSLSERCRLTPNLRRHMPTWLWSMDHPDHQSWQPRIFARLTSFAIVPATESVSSYRLTTLGVPQETRRRPVRFVRNGLRRIHEILNPIISSKVSSFPRGRITTVQSRRGAGLLSWYPTAP